MIMMSQREITHEERRLHTRRLLMSIASGMLIGGTIAVLRVLAIF